jgi:hypothetical protein
LREGKKISFINFIIYNGVSDVLCLWAWLKSDGHFEVSGVRVDENK